jgi:hypothetical protein
LDRARQTSRFKHSTAEIPVGDNKQTQ